MVSMALHLLLFLVLGLKQDPVTSVRRRHMLSTARYRITSAPTGGFELDILFQEDLCGRGFK